MRITLKYINFSGASFACRSQVTNANLRILIAEWIRYESVKISKSIIVEPNEDSAGERARCYSSDYFSQSYTTRSRRVTNAENRASVDYSAEESIDKKLNRLFVYAHFEPGTFRWRKVMTLSIPWFPRVSTVLCLRVACENNRANNHICAEADPPLKRTLMKRKLRGSKRYTNP